MAKNISTNQGEIMDDKLPMDDDHPTISDLIFAFAYFVVFGGPIIVCGIISALAGQ